MTTFITYKYKFFVPYQHFTNSIENYFSMLKSRLQKLDGLTHEKLKENIKRMIIAVCLNIPWQH